MILYIKHIDIEGPETLGAFFAEKGYPSQTIELYKGQKFPENLDDIEAVIVLGGPMNVDEEEKYPFLKEENIFIQKIVRGEKPYLGLCLGSQLLAKACQAKVGRSPKKEIGFSQVTLTQEGLADPLFSGLSPEIEVFQWHEDMFDVPGKAVLLAASPACPHQAFRVGPCAYGLQFHVEITGKSIEEWTQAYWGCGDSSREKEIDTMRQRYQNIKTKFDQTAEIVYSNFLTLLK